MKKAIFIITVILGFLFLTEKSYAFDTQHPYSYVVSGTSYTQSYSTVYPNLSIESWEYLTETVPDTLYSPDTSDLIDSMGIIFQTRIDYSGHDFFALVCDKQDYLIPSNVFSNYESPYSPELSQLSGVSTNAQVTPYCNIFGLEVTEFEDENGFIFYEYDSSEFITASGTNYVDILKNAKLVDKAYYDTESVSIDYSNKTYIQKIPAIISSWGLEARTSNPTYIRWVGESTGNFDISVPNNSYLGVEWYTAPEFTVPNINYQYMISHLDDEGIEYITYSLEPCYIDLSVSTSETEYDLECGNTVTFLANVAQPSSEQQSLYTPDSPSDYCSQITDITYPLTDDSGSIICGATYNPSIENAVENTTTLIDDLDSDDWGTFDFLRVAFIDFLEWAQSLYI
jgi:hypothetical protein